MAGLIPQQFIDDLLARVDIVDVIDNYVPLKKAGKNHQACCPFHNEKTPSFTVSQPKQFYHCFGCGANGSAIGFLMDYLNMGFVDAIEELASKFGMEIPREVTQASTTNNFTTELYELMELVTQFYTRQLRQHPDANKAVKYLKDRGISGEIAKEYELGYAPVGWDSLLKELGRSGNAAKRLATIGALIENDRGGHYDRFRDRVTFPIRDQRGRAIGMGGRVLDDSKPKYLNSPETPIFHKGRELYGFYQARKSLKNNDCIFIVEGYMDVIALAQFDIRNAVASLGTAATPEHVKKLFRSTSKIVFCFDGDKAGKAAAWRALENALPLLKDGKQVFFIFLPEGEDPDTFVRSNGKEAFIDNKLQTSLSDFLFYSLQESANLSSPEGKAAFAAEILPHIALLKTNAPVLCSLLIGRLELITNIPVKDLHIQLVEYKTTGLINQTIQKRQLKPVNSPRQQSLMAESIKLLLRQPSMALDESFTNMLNKIEVRGVEFLVEISQYIKRNPNATFASIIENYRDREKIRNRLLELAPSDSKYEADDDSAFSDRAIKERFIGALNKLIDLTNKIQLEELTSSNSAKSMNDEQKQKLLAIINRRNKRESI